MIVEVCHDDMSVRSEAYATWRVKMLPVWSLETELHQEDALRCKELKSKQLFSEADIGSAVWPDLANHFGTVLIALVKFISAQNLVWQLCFAIGSILADVHRPNIEQII